MGGASGALKVYGSKCLDVTDGNTANGAKMQIYGCGSGGVGDANQQWSATADNRIAWTNMGECLDLTNGSDTNGNVVSTCGIRQFSQLACSFLNGTLTFACCPFCRSKRGTAQLVTTTKCGTSPPRKRLKILRPEACGLVHSTSLPFR